MHQTHASALPGFLGVIDSAISRTESFLLAAGVLLMAANTVANVVGRFVLGNSLFFTEELNRILIILITFAGISYAARHARHIRMSALYDALPPGTRKALMVAISLVTAGFMFLLCFYAVTYIGAQAARGRLLPALQIPVWVILVWLPAGFFMTGMQYLLTAVRNLTSSGIYLSTRVQEGYGNAEEIEI